MTKKHSDECDMEARYQRAEYLYREHLSPKEISFNTSLIPHWIDDDHFWYERGSRTGKEYRMVNAATGGNEIAFDHTVFAKALTEVSDKEVNAENLCITKVDITLSPLRISFSAFDKRWTFKGKTASCEVLDTDPDNWLLSPDGKKAAYKRDYNLWVKDLTTGEEKALTRDGERHFCYAEWPSSLIGFRPPISTPDALWSPDGTRLFTHQIDSRQVKTLPILDHVPKDGSIRPAMVDAGECRVPLPGDEHVETYRFVALEVESGRIQEAYYRRCPAYLHGKGFLAALGTGWWAADSRRAYFLDMGRDSKIAHLVEFDTHTGITRIVLEESCADSMVRLSYNGIDYPVMLPLPETNELIWYSERSGWAHLYLYDLNTGELKNTITQGDWLVRDILHFDTEKRELLIRTAGRITGRNPNYHDICRVQIDSGNLTAVISTDHEYFVCTPNSILFFSAKAFGLDMATANGVSPDGRYVVATRSVIDDVPVSLLLDGDGTVTEVETADVSGLPEGWQWPESVKLLAADGKTDIYGAVYRPSDFSPDKSYPVIDYATTLPDDNSVPAGSFTNSFGLGLYFLPPTAFAELGFIVVCIDGRGTPGRNKAFTDYTYGSLMLTNCQEDRIAGIRQLAERYPYMDLDRVGAGGLAPTAAPLRGLLKNPEFYKVGVGEQTCGDGRLTSALYSDYWEGLPENNKVKELPLEELANNLQGKLLLIVSLRNAAIPPAVTFRVVDALQRANKDFDLMVLPKDGHEPSDYSLRLTWDYFVRHLLGVEPPKEFKLATLPDWIESTGEYSYSHSD